MLIASVIFLLAQLAAQPPVEGRFDGLCEYPEALQDRSGEGALVTCNQVEIAPGQISFGLRSWQSRTRFNGTFDGNRLTVTSITRPIGREWPVRGVCDLSFANGKLSNVACSAYARHATILANFTISSINDAR